jgi:hypothetical protein
VGSEYGREALILHEAVRVRYSTCTSCTKGIGRYLYKRGDKKMGYEGRIWC